uniref:LRR containing protein n=1 Tax=Parastrongyloides trichosuri TaxID=131310 RepID=A0A0N4ZVE4_PARTI
MAFQTEASSIQKYLNYDIKTELLPDNISSFDDKCNERIIKAEQVVDGYCKKLLSEHETLEDVLSLLALDRRPKKLGSVHFFMKSENYKCLEAFQRCRRITKERMRLLKLPANERIPYKWIDYNLTVDQSELNSHFKSVKSGKVETMSLTIGHLHKLNIPVDADSCHDLINIRINDKLKNLTGNLPKSLKMIWFDEYSPNNELSHKNCNQLHTIVVTNCNILDDLPNSYYLIPSLKYIVSLCKCCTNNFPMFMYCSKLKFSNRIDVLSENGYLQYKKFGNDPQCLLELKRNSIFKIYSKSLDDTKNVISNPLVAEDVIQAYKFFKNVTVEQQNLLNGF